MLQSFKLAVKSIWGNKMRSFLTMLGIIIGVAAVIILVSLVNGYMGTIVDNFASMGVKGNESLTSTSVAGRSEQYLEIKDDELQQGRISPIRIFFPVRRSA